jgi:hypothetical protein
VSQCPSFYCRRCDRSHPDECPPAAAKSPASPEVSEYVLPPGALTGQRTITLGVRVRPAAGLHDWEEQPVYDLSVRGVCKRCNVSHRRTVLDHHMGRNERPVDGCPGKPPF